MHHVDLRGIHAEMGRQQGLILRASDFNLPPPEPKMLRFARQCEERVARHAPELLEEMHGVAGKPGDCSIDVAAGYPCQNRYETVAF